MWANTPPNDVGLDSKQCHKYILDIAISMTLLLDFPQQQQVFIHSSTRAWFTILTPTSTSTSTIEMNPIPASTSTSTSKDAADVKAVSLKFDAQLSVHVIL